MDFHDDYARLTPFELAFPDSDALEELVDSVLEEAARLGVDPENRGAFMMLGSVGAFLRDFQPEDAASEAIHDYGALVFHAVHFFRGGGSIHLATVDLVRALVDEITKSATPPVLVAPGEAGYVQLPRNLFWVRPAPDAPAEPADGFFWTLTDTGVLQVLLALGLREGRPGMAVVAVPEVPWADAGQWLHAQGRDSGQDFETTLPGGELEGLYSLETAGEVLKLVARLFHHMETVPHTVEESAPFDAGPDEAVAPSRLPYRRVVPDA